MKQFLILLILLLTHVYSMGQNTAHTIPVAHITTIGGVNPTCEFLLAPEGLMGRATINNEYVCGRIVITDADSTIYDSGEYIEDDAGKRISGMRIRIRGNSSSAESFPSYKLKLSVKDDPLQMGSISKDWHFMRIYHSNDVALYNSVGRHVALLAGMEWQPDYRYIEMYLNGDYRGLYAFSETIDRADDRIDVSKKGFIAECDAYFWNVEDGYWFRSPYQTKNMGYTFKYPEEEDFDADPTRLTSISDWFAEMEDSLYNKKNIEDLISIKSFAAWHLAKDYLGETDLAGANMYMHKKSMEPTSKLKAGPLWDFDTSYKIGDTWHRHHTVNWMYGKQLFDRDEFVIQYLQFYDDTKDIIIDEVTNLIDEIHEYYGDNLDEAIARHNKRCRRSHPDVETQKEILVDYFSKRLEWLEDNMNEFYDRLPPDLPTEIHSSHNKTDVSVYTLSGVLITTIDNDNLSYIQELNLPKGIYVLKNPIGGGLNALHYLPNEQSRSNCCFIQSRH